MPFNQYQYLCYRSIIETVIMPTQENNLELINGFRELISQYENEYDYEAAKAIQDYLTQYHEK